MEEIKAENIYRQYMYSYPHKTAYRSLSNSFFSNYVSNIADKENGLYIHIPFCESKCGYCNLFSVSRQSEQLMEDYVNTLIRQSQEYKKYPIKIKDLTIGGGTPLILSEKYLDYLFLMIKDNFIWRTEYRDLPKIIETSPSQTTLEKVRILKNYGVTRVSIGIQSFHDKELETLNRRHNSKMIYDAVDILKKAEFSCLNMDLIYGIKGQTKESVLQSLKTSLSYEPEEMFIYPLYIKAGTWLYENKSKVSSNAYELYCYMREYLLENGYLQMSMRRFVKEDYNKKQSICKGENGNSCGDENVISIGCGGRSYLENIHFCTPFYIEQAECVNVIKNYIAKCNFDKIEHGIILTQEELKRRFVIRNLLTVNGLNIDQYDKKFKADILKDFEIIRELIENEFVSIENGYLLLNQKGLSLSDYIGPMFISPEVKERMNQYHGAN